MSGSDSVPETENPESFRRIIQRDGKTNLRTTDISCVVGRTRNLFSG